MDMKDFNAFLADYLKRYKGISVYQEDQNGPCFYQWNYEDGCLMLGCKQMYEATGDAHFKDYIVNFVNPYVSQDGAIRSYDMMEYNLDFINAGKVFYFLYDVTGEERYRKACDTLMDQLRHHPRLTTGNFWHKLIYPWQVWLDGLYMAQPFYMEYENRFDDYRGYQDIVRQFTEADRLLFDEKTGLYHHAYDEYKERKWANPKTGLSPNFWLRSIGWYLMALVDCYELANEELYDHKRAIGDLFRKAIRGILRWQDPDSKLFYQLVALPEQEGNYLETSGSLMVAYAILKACRLGLLLADKYQRTGEEIFEAVLDQKLAWEDGHLHLTDTCAVAGLGPKETRDGSVAYYLSEPVVWDDPKAQGVLMMAYAQYLKTRGG